MTLDNFIKTNNLRGGDAIIVKKDVIGLLDHYLIYLGKFEGEHKFIANYFSGTKILTYSDLFEFSNQYHPTRIRRFVGNDIQRQAAIYRAISRQDQSSYHLILNNCEHYANYVQTGREYSQQTTIFGTGMAVSGLAVAASAKSESTRGLGVVMTVLGLLTLMIDNNE